MMFFERMVRLAIRYRGHRALALENEYLRLEYLVDAGPRIVGLYLAGSQDNLLAELDEKGIDTPYGIYFLLGGHRLWYAPEKFPDSYYPDGKSIQVKPVGTGVCLEGNVELPQGIRKAIEIHLDDHAPRVQLHHYITNEGSQPIELAPWALTMLPHGGLIILPQPMGNLNQDALLPNRHLVQWPYSSWKDQRLSLNDDYVLINAVPSLPPLKIGYFNQSGSVGYLREDILFTKKFRVYPGKLHTDFGCNSECYCNDRFVELETVGPLQFIQPGESTRLDETWEFTRLSNIPLTLAGIQKLSEYFR